MTGSAALSLEALLDALVEAYDLLCVASIMDTVHREKLQALSQQIDRIRSEFVDSLHSPD